MRDSLSFLDNIPSGSHRRVSEPHSFECVCGDGKLRGDHRAATAPCNSRNSGKTQESSDFCFILISLFIKSKKRSNNEIGRGLASPSVEIFLCHLMVAVNSRSASPGFGGTKSAT